METIVYDAFSPVSYRNFVPTETVTKNKNLSQLIIGSLVVAGICIFIYQLHKSSTKKKMKFDLVSPYF